MSHAMTSLTIEVEQETLERALELAARQGTTIQEFLRKQLGAFTRPTSLDAVLAERHAFDRWLERSVTPPADTGERRRLRDELYEGEE